MATKITTALVSPAQDLRSATLIGRSHNEHGFHRADADERHKEAIAAAIRTMREITIRMSNEEVFGQTEFLTEVLPAVILDQIGCWGYGDSYEDLNTVVLATQKLHDKLAQWEEGEYHPEGLGCKWSDSHYEGKFINLDLPHIKP